MQNPSEVNKLRQTKSDSFPELAKQVCALLEEELLTRGFLKEKVELDRLHLHLQPEQLVWDENNLNPVTISFYQFPAPVLNIYHQLISRLAGQEKIDFLFQQQPILRFHFPGPFPKKDGGINHRFHFDLLGGHPAQMTQAWWALTPASYSNSLFLSDPEIGKALLERFTHHLPNEISSENCLNFYYDFLGKNPDFNQQVVDACKPQTMDSGDLRLFSPYCLHGGRESQEESTRVSLDFRIFPLGEAPTKDFEKEIARKYPRFERGQIFHPLTAWELKL